MTDHEPPRWDLLPHNPEEFFGLTPPYDRRELKRRYNAKLRLFKPEHCPQEFQRIRTAYEELDNALRYGESFSHRTSWDDSNGDSSVVFVTPSSTPATSRRRAAAQDSGQPDPAASASSAESQPLAERLQGTPAATLFAELRERPTRLPHDYYALAVLSDLVETEPANAFTLWLLAGLKDFPADRGLFRLSYLTLPSVAGEAAIRELLLAAADAVRDDRFFYLTEGAWDRFLREAPFEVFSQTLDACEAKLIDFAIDARLTFYIHILKQAVWKATDQWIQRVQEFINHNHPLIAWHLQSDLVFLDLLAEYRAVRVRFVVNHSLRREMDQAIQQFCIDDQLVADRSVVDFQQRLTASDAELLEAFPPTMEPDSAVAAALMVWEWITAEVHERLGDRQPDSEQSHANMRLMLRRVVGFRRQKILLSLLSVLHVGCLCTSAAIVACFGIACVLSLANTDAVAALSTVISIIGGAIAFFFVRGKTSGWAPRLAYRRHWRPELLRLLRATHAPWENVLSEFLAMVSTKQITVDVEIVKLVRADQGLKLFSQAQQGLAGM